MKDKLLPWFLLFCALGLSGTAAYYSVVGLSVVFVGVSLPVIVMGSFLEISKLAIATYLHDKWKETYGVLKIYMTIALVTLSLITSLGIYGLLSTGFSSNIAKLEIGQKEVKNIEVKKQRFEEIKGEYQKEKQTLDKDISKLRDALSSNTTTQSVDRQTGQLITRANNANRKSFETQLTMAIENRDKMSLKIDALNDSITKLDIEILNKESAEIMKKYVPEYTIVPGPLQKIIPMDANKGVYMIAYSDNSNALIQKKYLKDTAENRNLYCDLIEESLGIPSGSLKIIAMKDFYWPIGTHYYEPLKGPYRTRNEFVNKAQHPQNGMLVVGEAISRYQGWTEGALESVKTVLSKDWVKSQC